MVHFINNIIDILWIITAAIAIIVLIVTLSGSQVSIRGVLLFLLISGWLIIGFCLNTGWKIVKKFFKKKSKWMDIDDHDLFI
jgi:steroid 5-alpha reductase family enzyme